jgi:broad specificity phosphatase PhoE
MEILSPQLTLYLVRHGEAEHNVRQVLDSIVGNEVYALTPRGREQITAVAEAIASDGSIDAILSSPMPRTRETAGIIAAKTGIEKVLYDFRLRETDFGQWEGQPIQKFFEKYPTPETRIETDGTDGVESFLSQRDRCAEFLADLKEHYLGKRVVIISHGDTLEQLHGLIIGESVSEAAMGWSPAKGEMIRMKY